MKIKEKSKVLDRNGNTKWYFTVLNNRGDDYVCVITISNNKIISKECDCFFGTQELSRRVKTNKDCRHIKFALSELKDGNE